MRSTRLPLKALLAPVIAFLLAGSIGTAPALASPGPEDRSSSEAETAVVEELEPGEYYALMGEELFVFTTSSSIHALDGVTVADNPSGRASTQALWAACGVRDKSTKMVRDFSRSMISGVSGKSAHLRCGTAANWGYRHIKANHLAHWQAKVAYVGGSWQPFTDWAIRNTLAKPCTKYRRLSNDTLQYVAPIEIRNSQGALVHRFGTRVSVARGTQNIITSFPQTATCS